MAVKTEYLSVENYTDRQNRVVQRILDSLSKVEARLSDHYSQVRSHQRKRCHNLLYVRIGQRQESPAAFTVHMRDVSASGTSFIYPGELDATSLMIGIPIPGRDATWFQGEVVRCKQIMGEEFWDYGVRFRERLV